MTLTALNSSLLPENPAELVRRGKQPLGLVNNLMRQRQTTGKFSCYHCYIKTGELVPVVFVSGSEFRRPHFRHLVAVDAEDRCSNYAREGDRHVNAITAIAAALREQGEVQISFDFYMKDPESNKFSEPDILVTDIGGNKIAHEIQISPITSAQLKKRTAKLLEYGCSKVLWYLYGDNYNSENRTWIHYNRSVECWRLWFHNSDPELPEWSRSSGLPEENKPTYGKGKDSCSGRKLGQDRLNSGPVDLRSQPLSGASASIQVVPEPKSLKGLYRHINPNLAKHNWHGRIVADYGDVVDVVWEEAPIPGATICNHPLYQRSYNRVHVPERFPKTLLMPWVDSDLKEAA